MMTMSRYEAWKTGDGYARVVCITARLNGDGTLYDVRYLVDPEKRTWAEARNLAEKKNEGMKL